MGSGILLIYAGHFYYTSLLQLPNKEIKKSGVYGMKLETKNTKSCTICKSKINNEIVIRANSITG